VSGRPILAVIAAAIAAAALPGEEKIGQDSNAVRAVSVADPERPDTSVAQVINGRLEDRDPNGSRTIASHRFS
jgi:hypothetical protein